jgi:hypothetical protein
MVAGEHEHLGLACETPKRRVVEDPVPITFEACSIWVGFLLGVPVSAPDPDRRMLGQQYPVTFLTCLSAHDLGLAHRGRRVGVRDHDLVVTVACHRRSPPFGTIARVIEEWEVVHCIEDRTEPSE